MAETVESKIAVIDSDINRLAGTTINKFNMADRIVDLHKICMDQQSVIRFLVKKAGVDLG